MRHHKNNAFYPLEIHHLHKTFLIQHSLGRVEAPFPPLVTSQSILMFRQYEEVSTSHMHERRDI